MDPFTLALLIGGGTALIGGGTNLISGGMASRGAAEQMNKYRAALEADKAEAKAKEQYYENISPLDTKSGRAMSTEMAQQLSDVNTAAAGRNAVAGGHGFNTAATKNATSQLMAEYNRSLIKQHEMNVVPQLNYYRSMYGNASAASQKAQHDQAMANIQAASEAWKGVGQAINAGGSAAANFMMLNSLNGNSGNGTTPQAQQTPKADIIGAQNFSQSVTTPDSTTYDMLKWNPRQMIQYQNFGY